MKWREKRTKIAKKNMSYDKESKTIEKRAMMAKIYLFSKN